MTLLYPIKVCISSTVASTTAEEEDIGTRPWCRCRPIRDRRSTVPTHEGEREAARKKTAVSGESPARPYLQLPVSVDVARQAGKLPHENRSERGAARTTMPELVSSERRLVAWCFKRLRGTLYKTTSTPTSLANWAVGDEVIAIQSRFSRDSVAMQSRYSRDIENKAFHACE